LKLVGLISISHKSSRYYILPFNLPTFLISFPYYLVEILSSFNWGSSIKTTSVELLSHLPFPFRTLLINGNFLNLVFVSKLPIGKSEYVLWILYKVLDNTNLYASSKVGNFPSFTALLIQVIISLYLNQS
jgi:hypothetical protein